MPDIYINYGTDMQAMTRELMAEAGVAAMLSPSMRVAIKPNLVVARPADGGATTHPEIVEGIIQFLQERGVKDTVIAEGSWVGDSTERAFGSCGYTELSKKYNVPLVDTKRDAVVKRRFEDMNLALCESVVNADFLINVPVLKGHCQTDMTCCLKNMKGCIPDSEKRRFHTMGLDRPIAALNTVLKPQLHIIDSICGDLTFEEGGNPQESNRVLLGFNPVLLDSYCAGLMGYYPDEIGHLHYARQYGVGEYYNERTEIVELNADNKPGLSMERNSIAKHLARHIEEDGACSACYAALVFAMSKAGTHMLHHPVKIGQGYRGKKCAGLGVGNCTAGCDKFVKGCPPSAVDIVECLDGM